MEGTEFIAFAERNTKVIAAMRGALEAMALTHGTRIAMVGMSGVLNFNPQIAELKVALALLGDDPSFPPFYDAKTTRTR